MTGEQKRNAEPTEKQCASPPTSTKVTGEQGAAPPASRAKQAKRKPKPAQDQDPAAASEPVSKKKRAFKEVDPKFAQECKEATAVWLVSVF